MDSKIVPVSSIAPEGWGPKEGGNATSPLHSRGSPTKETKSEVKTYARVHHDAPSISKCGSLVQPGAQIAALCKVRPLSAPPKRPLEGHGSKKMPGALTFPPRSDNGESPQCECVEDETTCTPSSTPSAVMPKGSQKKKIRSDNQRLSTIHFNVRGKSMSYMLVDSTILQGFPYELPPAGSGNPRRPQDRRGPHPHADKPGSKPVSLIRRTKGVPTTLR